MCKMTEDNFVSDVVDKLKKQGLFDRFRKECLADVDTKPAYQNLQVRVKEAVGKYLHVLKWKSDLNKNQLRENLRRHLNDLPMLTNGIDRVVDQVVKPKILKSLKPQIDRVVCDHMGFNYEEWLNNQNDVLKKKAAKADDSKILTAGSVLTTPSGSVVVTASFPPAIVAMASPVVTPVMSIPSSFPPLISDLKAPPPPPPPPPPIPPEADKSIEPEPTLAPSDLHLPPPPPPPPPPPSDPQEKSGIPIPVPAPPPDLENVRNIPPPPLPPEEDENCINDEPSNQYLQNTKLLVQVDHKNHSESNQLPGATDLCEIIMQEEANVNDQEVLTSEEVVIGDNEVVSIGEEDNTMEKNPQDVEMLDRNDYEQFDETSRFSDNKSFDESVSSNDNSISQANVDHVNIQGTTKEYKFAWDDLNESDLSDISVSSVHTSDLSSFEDDADDDSDEVSAEYRTHLNKEANKSKGEDCSKCTKITTKESSNKKSLDDSVSETLDTSNVSGASSKGRKRLKKEEMKERKMEEKKMELKRRRILNRKYCSEEFTSIFSTKKNFLEGRSSEKEEVKAASPKSVEKHKSKSEIVGSDEDSRLNRGDNESDVDNVNSPYSNISDASSDSVVVVGVEPAKPKKRKKSKSQKKTCSSDGSRRKTKRKRHKSRSSRKSSHHWSGPESDDDDDGDAMSTHLQIETVDSDGDESGENRKTLRHKQEELRSKSGKDHYGSNKNLPDHAPNENDDDDDEEEEEDSFRKKSRKSVDKINFGEAARQAAAFRTMGGNKQPGLPAVNPMWQKQPHNLTSRSPRTRPYGPLPNFLPPPPPIAIHRHAPHSYPSVPVITPPYHQSPSLSHTSHDSHRYDHTRGDAQSHTSSKHVTDIERFRSNRSSTRRPHSIDTELYEGCSGDVLNISTEGTKMIRHKLNRHEGLSQERGMYGSHLLKSDEDNIEKTRSNQKKIDHERASSVKRMRK